MTLSNLTKSVSTTCGALGIGLLALVFSDAPANAATFDFGTVITNSAGASVSVDVAVGSDATILTGFDLTTQGDFNSSFEFVDVSIDGISIGRLFDEVTENDPFDFINDDDSGRSTAISSFADLAIDITALTNDGLLTILFDTSSEVNAGRTGAGVFDGYYFISAFQGSLTVENNVSAVPLPAALPLLAGGMGLLGFAGWRKKRTAKIAV